MPHTHTITDIYHWNGKSDLLCLLWTTTTCTNTKPWKRAKAKTKETDWQCQSCLQLKIRKYFKIRLNKTYLKRSRSTEKAHIRFCGFDRDQSFFPFLRLCLTIVPKIRFHAYVSDQSKQKGQFFLSVKKFKRNRFCLFVSIFCSFQPKILPDCYSKLLSAKAV